MNARFSRCLLLFATSATTVTSVSTARAYFEGDERWTQHTAYVLRPAEFEIGVLQADLGIARGLEVGTDTFAWAAGLFLPASAPNAHVKVSPFPDGKVTVALRGGYYYATIRSDDGSKANLSILPFSAFASVDVTRALSLHLEGQYTFITGTGTTQPEDTAVAGAAATASLQLGAMAMWRLGRVAALYARGRYQPWQRGVRVDASAQTDAFTSVEAHSNVKPMYALHAWQALFGVAVSSAMLSLELGVGYGDAFLPSIGVVAPYRGVLPDANLFVRF